MAGGGRAPRAGVVRAAVGGVYEVELDSGDVLAASLRGRIKKQDRTRDRVVAGDRVLVDVAADGAATIDAVEPRRSALSRRAPGRGGHHAKLIAANIDAVLPVFAATHPEPHLRMLDRFLVLAESNGLPARVIVNKIDLLGHDAARALFADYERAGYAVVLVSARAAIGLDALRAQVCGATSVFTGPSGVGKSSLLNALQPGLALRTGEVSEVVRKGKHTTVSARLVPLDCGGYVVDTPGLRELGLWGIEPAELDACFPEFRPYLGTCRFARSCTHTHEPGCAVREAVAAGDISAPRYDSYAALLAGDPD
ncbi:MAG: ribosome small subunit-dependent GTPase A [Longimicrobiales bacterium]